MFLKIDVVDFNLKDSPYTTIHINMNHIWTVEPIRESHREWYRANRQKSLETIHQANLPEDLPAYGAVIYLDAKLPIYTVTPYKTILEALDIKDLSM